MIAPSRKSKMKSFDIWPGYVDALSALLMVIIFVLLTFVLAQFSLSQLLNDKDIKVQTLETSLNSLRSQISDLSKNKEANRKFITSLQDTLSTLQADHKIATGTRDQLKKESVELKDLLYLRENEIVKFNKSLLEIEDTLKITIENKLKVHKDLEGERTLHNSLKDHVVELEKDAEQYKGLKAFSKHRSSFFDQLQKVLGDRNDIRVVGDRFVFQSEVLFDKASADIGKDGKKQLDQIVTALKEITKKIPKDVPWILRVDGHTDSLPIKNIKFPSNWELSAARSISVVRYLILKGIPAKHLVAAGFGENRPIEDDKKSAKNRRIEFKLDQD